MLAIFGSTNLLKADEVTIGDPAGATTNSYYPVYSLYNYSFTQQIYTAEEIGTAGTINSLTMWLKNSSSNPRNVQIYMKNVSKAAFGSLTDWVPMSAADLVATGTINNGVSTPQAVTFTLSTPFEYDDAMNLVICFADVTGGWSSGAASVTFAGEAARTLYIYRDASAFDIANPGTANNSDTYRSVVMLDITPAGGSVVVTPSTLDLERPNNAWMEPAYINVKNTNPDGAVVSTSFVTYPEMFDASTMLNNVELGYKEDVNVEIKPAAGAECTVEAAMIVTFDTPEKDAVVATINADFYTAVQPDVVEFAQAVIADTMNFAPEFSALHHNYNLPNAIEGGKDAVYTFTLTTPKVFSAYTTGNGHVALYDTVQPKADNALMEAASFEDVILLPGTYYLIAESASEFDLYVQLEDFQPLTEAPTLVAPTNGAMEVATAPTLAWTLPEGTVEYRLLVNTAYNLPVATSVVVDWTTELVTEYTLSELYGATQYFWRVDARGADGTVMSSAKWGFTTTISAPTNLEADNYEIFVGDDVELKWKGGVSTGFEGEITVSDGTATDSYVPVYGLYTDAYLKCNIVYPAEMLAEMEGGEITSMKFYLSSSASAAWDPAHFVVYMMEVPGTTVSAFTEPENATIVYEGSLNGTGTEMVVTLDTPFEYEGGNLLVGVNNTVIGTYKSCSFYGTTVSGASVQGYSYSSLSAITPTQRNFIPKTTFVCGEAKGSINDRTFIGFNLYDNEVKVNDELIVEKKYTVSGLDYNMDGHHFAVTEVHSEGESGYSNIANVKVSGNGYASGIVYDIDGVTPLEGITVMFNGQDEFGDDVEYSAVTAETGFYYTELKAGTYRAKTVHPEFTSVSADIVVEYDATTTTDFILHENYNPAAAVVAEEIDETMAKVSWSLGSMPGPGGAGDEFYFGFESDLEGWTNIDNDGDGHMWYHSSEAGNHSTMAVTSHTGVGHVMGESYCNASWLALTPDDYMVTPQKYNIGGSSVFSFWACAQDVNYPAEHFGVAISTASNTSAADFTTIAEWTLTAKGSRTLREAGAKAKVRGENTREGVWYQYQVDLSAFAGQQAWIAIRHFNCSDQFMMCVDDVEMVNAGKGGRSLQYYTIYRQKTMEEGATTMIPEEELNPEVVNAACTDTAYVDFNWGNMETGVYQYGVQVTYDGNHNPTREMQTLIEEGFEGGAMPEGWTSDSWTVGTGTDSYVTTAANGSYNARCTIHSGISYLITPVMDLSGAESGTLTFNVVNPNYFGDIDELGVYYRVAGGDWNELYYNVDEHTTWTPVTVELSGFASDYQIGFRMLSHWGHGLGIDDVIVAAEISGADSPVTPITWSNMLGKNMDMTLDLAVTASNMGDVRGAHVTMTNISEEYAAIVYEAELDSTGLYTFEGFRKGNYMVTVECPTYATFTEEVAFWGDQTYTVALAEDYAPVSNFAVSSTGWAHWTAPLGNIDHYQVMMNNVFQGNTEMNGMQLDVEGLTEGQTYTAKVAAVYTTGMSTWETATFSYKECSNFETGIEALNAFADCMDVTFSWGGGVPTPPTPGDGDEFFEEFETGAIPTGWTTIDADGDGFNWTPASVLMAGYLIPAHGGADCITSQSYSSSAGALTPDNYLVSPKVKITTGSEFSFWACAQDPDYASEHYGVAISTTTATAGAFTTIAEWTMTAKEEAGAGAYMSRDGKGTREGNWYQKTVDLSSYAGQEVYIAIRHFNCTDWFYLNVDDARLQIAGAPVPPPTGEATIVLQADDVWGDGSGYQMLLDNTHSLYGTTIPETGALSMNCSGNEAIYAQFSHKIPANADGNCSTSNMVCGSSVSITIPAGTYDWCITNPTPGDRIWIASSGGSIGGRYNDYTFEGGKTYTFHVYFGGANDATDLTISGGKSAQPKMAVESNDCKNISDVVVLNGNRDEYLQYCTENYSGAVGTGGGQVWWANAYTPAQLADYDGRTITHVGQWVSAPDMYGNIYDGTYNVEVYVGGSTSAPGTLVASASQYITGDDAWHDLELNQAVTIDATQHIWFVFNANGIGYPMCGCDYVGDPNSDILSLDGAVWEHAASGYGLSYTWMIRAFVEAGSGPTPGPGGAEMTENTWALFLDGEFIECVSLDQTTYGMTMNDTEEHEFTVVRVYSSFDMSCPTSVVFAAGGVSMPANLTAEDTEDGVRLTWVGFADTYKVYRGTSMSDFVEIGTTNDLTYLDGFNGGSYYGVRAVTDCGESDMAIVSYDNVGELNTEVAIYPNPTSGDVNILVNGMQQVTIVNTLGQVVFSQNVNADQMTINMSQFGTGMFIINIVTENGTSTKRVNVIK
ncbi:MAG: choice-of-anchor J domain-containing protein [Bacteroidales bacterium]|nr:choice-of-anchor J domain-containing protein [Bacteroidales bacterium]